MVSTAILPVAAVVLLGTIVVGLWRALRGPELGDRLMAFTLLGTGGAALLLVLGSALDVPAFRDAAVGVVVLATVASVVGTRRPRA